MRLQLITVAAVAMAALATGSVPALSADNGSIVGTVTALGGGACLELTNTAVDFGAVPFSTRSSTSSAQAKPAPTFKNCANLSESVSISGADATGATSPWRLNDFAGNPCFDQAGKTQINAYALLYDAPPVGQVQITKTPTPISTYAADVTTPLALRLDMPCIGSAGDGQTVSFSINLTAAVA